MLVHRALIVASAVLLAPLVACDAVPPDDTPSNPTNQPPAPPAGLTATAGDAQVALDWAPSATAGTYNIKRTTTRGGPYTQISVATNSIYVDTSVTNGVTYCYVVTITTSSESRNSNEACATPNVDGENPPPPPPPPPHTGDGSACGLVLADSDAIFCETFDAPAGIGNRAGDLDGNVWGVSRGSSVNIGQGEWNLWSPTTMEGCDGTLPQKVLPPNDILICDGQLREAMNDNNSGVWDAGTVTALTIYPKQPFDFAGRTGTVSFDVSNDSAGTHAAWPEFWITNLPVPAPFNHFDSWQSNPQHGFGLRFAGTAAIGQYGSCPNGNNLDKYRWTVDSAAVFRDYVLDDTNGYGPRRVQLNIKDCVVASDGAGTTMNHVEVRVSEDRIEVWATDAGVAPTIDTLKLIAELIDVDLTFTRGLIWIEDAHYNADKGPTDRPSQREHTFAWDNVAFDGPFTYRDFSYDAPDNTLPGPNGGRQLGKAADANATTSWSVAGMPANRQAATVRVLFNGYGYEAPAAFNVTVNGHAHSVPNPYTDGLAYTWRTYAMTVPIADLVTGTNTVQLGADKTHVFTNVNIVLVDVPNGVPVLPGSDNTYPN